MRTSPGVFLCPLRGACFAAASHPFRSYAAANDAVARYQAAVTDSERYARARSMFRRCLPLVRKTLHRFCHPFRAESRCYPGACLPEDLLGETYPLFRRALDEFDPSVGVDFLGYVSRRLYWGLEHRARRTEQARHEATGMDPDELSQPAEENRLLDRILIDELIARLDPEDADLITRYAAGHSCEELAQWAGISNAAVRKRLQRVRSRLRALAAPE